MKLICPFCKKTKAEEVILQGKYRLFACNTCGLCYLVPMPTRNEISRLYREEYFQKSHFLAAGYKDYRGMESLLKSEAKRKLHFMEAFRSGNKLLDMGSGTGVFLRMAKSQGYMVHGNDISQYATRYMRTQKIPVYTGPIEKVRLPRNSFDVITAWDVFEHIPAINAVCTTLHSALKPRGYLFLTTPDLQSIDARILGQHWYGFKKIPEHLLFFSPSSITKILSARGFEVLKITPWGFERSLEFLAAKMGLYSRPLGNLLLKTLNLFSASDISVYLPLTDMMVVARKIK